MTTLPNLDDLARLAREAQEADHIRLLGWHELEELRREDLRFRDTCAAFIAAASPAVVVGLCSEVEQLRASLAATQAKVGECERERDYVKAELREMIASHDIQVEHCNKMINERDQALARVEMMRAWIKGAQHYATCDRYESFTGKDAVCTCGRVAALGGGVGNGDH